MLNGWSLLTYAVRLTHHSLTAVQITDWTLHDYLPFGLSFNVCVCLHSSVQCLFVFIVKKIIYLPIWRVFSIPVRLKLQWGWLTSRVSALGGNCSSCDVDLPLNHLKWVGSLRFFANVNPGLVVVVEGGCGSGGGGWAAWRPTKVALRDDERRATAAKCGELPKMTSNVGVVAVESSAYGKQRLSRQVMWCTAVRRTWLMELSRRLIASNWNAQTRSAMYTVSHKKQALYPFCFVNNVAKYWPHELDNI